MVVPLFMSTKSAQFCANYTKKLFQEIVHPMLFTGGFTLESCCCLPSLYRKFQWLCRKAKGNQCNIKVLARAIAYLECCAGEKGAAAIFAFPLPAHALNLNPTWHSRAAPVLFLGISVSGEVTSWMCSLLNCKYSITMHRERLFTLHLCCPICMSVMNSHTKLCAVHSKCSISCKSFLTTNTSPASCSINCSWRRYQANLQRFSSFHAHYFCGAE